MYPKQASDNLKRVFFFFFTSCIFVELLALLQRFVQLLHPFTDDGVAVSGSSRTSMGCFCFSSEEQPNFSESHFRKLRGIWHSSPNSDIRYPHRTLHTSFWSCAVGNDARNTYGHFNQSFKVLFAFLNSDLWISLTSKLKLYSKKNYVFV